MLPVVGHVHGLRETLRVSEATANVALALMKYTHALLQPEMKPRQEMKPKKPYQKM